jgi:hypothetical protein
MMGNVLWIDVCADILPVNVMIILGFFFFKTNQLLCNKIIKDTSYFQMCTSLVAQECHGPFLANNIVKGVVLALFAGFFIISIVSPLLLLLLYLCLSFCLDFTSLHYLNCFFDRHSHLGYNLAWSNRLFFPETLIYKYIFLFVIHLVTLCSDLFMRTQFIFFNCYRATLETLKST